MFFRYLSNKTYFAKKQIIIPLNPQIRWFICYKTCLSNIFIGKSLDGIQKSITFASWFFQSIRFKVNKDWWSSV